MTTSHSRAPAVVRRWKRILAVGCSHGVYADQHALDAVYRFIKAFKPHTVVHLGDFMDTGAFRRGASEKEAAEPVRPDIECGLHFLKAIKANIVCLGNHEHRLWRLAQSPSAIVAELSQIVVKEIETTCKKLHAKLVPYHILRGYYTLSDIIFAHGFFYNVMACRDMAEAFCDLAHPKVVFAHTHTTGMAKGRNRCNGTGYNVGTLAEIPNLDYAMQRRQSMAWSGGFVWGEYSDKESMLWLHQNGQNLERKPWRLPV